MKSNDKTLNKNRDKTVRNQRKKLIENKKIIKKSKFSEVMNKLFKVKHIDDDIMFENINSEGQRRGHYVLTVAINPQNMETGVVQINSLSDLNDNPTKLNRVRNGFILPVEDTMTTGSNRRTGISMDVYTKNKRDNTPLKYNDLNETNRPFTISKIKEKDIAKHVFDNDRHPRISASNNEKTSNMIKIK